MPKHPHKPFFLIYFQSVLPPGSSSVPEREEMSADRAFAFHGGGTVLICSRKVSSKHTNTDTCS